MAESHADRACAAQAPLPAPAPALDPRWALLAAPFPADQIEKLPKGNTFLDYVGHAGITMRLNEVFGPDNWDWEPMALDGMGLPLIHDGMLWIYLTINGVTKKGVGDAAGKKGANAVKEMIGDAIRNAAMRFGVATYLWSKSEAADALKGQADEAPSNGQRAPERQARPQRANPNWSPEQRKKSIQNAMMNAKGKFTRSPDDFRFWLHEAKGIPVDPERNIVSLDQECVSNADILDVLQSLAKLTPADVSRWEQVADDARAEAA